MKPTFTLKSDYGEGLTWPGVPHGWRYTTRDYPTPDPRYPRYAPEVWVNYYNTTGQTMLISNPENIQASTPIPGLVPPPPEAGNPTFGASDQPQQLYQNAHDQISAARDALNKAEQFLAKLGPSIR